VSGIALHEAEADPPTDPPPELQIVQDSDVYMRAASPVCCRLVLVLVLVPGFGAGGPASVSIDG
jgi:hypothetical protein